MQRSAPALLAFLIALLIASIAPAAAQSPAPPFLGTVAQNVNVRAGPGTTYNVVGSLAAGATVNVRTCNDGCTWYLIGNQQWVAAFLVTPGRAAPQPVAPSAPAGLPTNSTSATVNYVVDGDTIDVNVNGANYRLRYIGMDTTESGQLFFQEAKDFNAQLVDGKTVYLEKDVNETDRYGRLLRYVYLGNGRMVNEELVAAGLAYASTYPPDVKYQQRLAAAQQAAQTAGRGLWAASTAAPAPTGASCRATANMRQGPGINYAVAGQCAAGQGITVSGVNDQRDWLLLASGAWIAASLVDNVPSGLSVVAGAAPPAPAVTAPPAARVQAVPASGNCDPSYPTVCIPPSPPDLDCGQISHRRFQVAGSDPHRFDGDHDGIGCEN